MDDEKAMSDVSYQSRHEAIARERLVRHLRESPIPTDQMLANMGLFLDAKAFSRLLFLDHIYKLILEVPGVVLDLGTRWGQNAAVFTTLRGMYEPFNRHRKIICFDTFKGFPEIHPNDGESPLMQSGRLATGSHYQDLLVDLLETHEALNPLNHIRKSEVISGDARETLPTYLERNQHTIVALAYFDFDLYEPTLSSLTAIRERLTRGSVLAFDELNDEDSPGETLALRQAFGLNRVTLRRLPITARTAYFVVE